MMMTTTTKKLVLSLIGPPGSGKGSYGRPLAEAFNLSLIGMSDVLRRMRPDLDLASGGLVDDTIVTQSLHEYLQSHHHGKDDDGSTSRSRRTSSSTRGYLLDGFPRTLGQLEVQPVMLPPSSSSAPLVVVDAALQLAVPDFVCETKLMGRRLCEKCGGNFNVNGVEHDGWSLPPTLPTSSSSSSTTITCSSWASQQQACPWVTRWDDRPHVVRQRLQTYHKHMDPIVDFFQQQNRLLKLTPFKGFKEIPNMIEQVRAFLRSNGILQDD